MKRIFRLDKNIESIIELGIQRLNYNFNETKKISESILKLSDFFIENPEASTPWSEKWCQLAYLVYYFPLNYLRAKAVTEEGLKVGFFDKLETLYDFGTGLGSAVRNLDFIRNQNLIETSRIPIDLANLDGKWLQSNPKNIESNSLGIFSFSLTELKTLPAWAFNCEALMIIEPATRDDGRKLLTLRQELIANGFSIWAPCLHQQNCPLLLNSKSDWCHDRIFFEQPEWFKKIENSLPIKNQTLTMSYLLARKKPAQNNDNQLLRAVGDQLIEKGKTRMMVCRSQEREFLSWLDRDSFDFDWQRGEIIKLPTHIENKNHELRIKK